MSTKTFEQISEETALYFATEEVKKLQTKVAVLEKVIIETKDLLLRIREYVDSHMAQ